MDKPRFYTLTSSAGRFEFPTHVRLSHAKLIRDTITAVARGAVPGCRIDKAKPHLAARWIREHLQGPVANAAYGFDWIPG